MLLRRKAKPAPPEEGGLTREQALACRPVKCPLVTEEVLSDSQVRLCYPLSLKPWFARLAARFGAWDTRPRTKRLELDAMGTTAWRLMDGRRNVLQVVEAMAEAYGLQPREAELSVSAFIKDLGRRGLLALHHGEPPKKSANKRRRRGGKAR